MASFLRYQMPNGTGRRLTGFQRYCELIGRDFKKFLLANLLTLLGFLPLAAGVILAVLSSSILILIFAGIIGGAAAGPALACMYDMVLRSLRDAPGRGMENYKRAWKQNWRQAVLPGILFCLLLGFYVFMLGRFWASSAYPGFGTLAVYFTRLLLLALFFSVYWPLLVLFEQTGLQRFKNSLVFIFRYFFKVLGVSLLQFLYWFVFALFLPGSLFTLPFAGIWFTVFTAGFLLYDSLNGMFQIEEEIAKAFPEQAAFYEDDEAWLARKQAESSEERK